MFKSSETGGRDCHWTQRWSGKQQILKMQYMDEVKVFENSNRDECTTETGRTQIPTDWVDIN